MLFGYEYLRRFSFLQLLPFLLALPKRQISLMLDCYNFYLCMYRPTPTNHIYKILPIKSLL